MKRIVLCFDGTWDQLMIDSLKENRHAETNVRRFHDSIAPVGPDAVAQLRWYNEGGGMRRGDQLTRGDLGVLLDQHVFAGYCHLVDTYENGDEVFVLGFSRGAYAARCLVGMIRNCGLVRKEFAPQIALVAYGIYRTRDDGPDSMAATAFRDCFSRPLTIRFLGLWDTVGELGIPFQLAPRLNRDFYKFHDATLSKIVHNAYQALALDEHRPNYQACLWDGPPHPSQTIEQRWFAGAHGDVGGGYPERELADLPLRWMQERAAALGLGLKPVSTGEDNYRGKLHNSFREFLNGYYCRVHSPFYRRVFDTEFGNEVLDASLERRRQNVALDYHPQNEGLPLLVHRAIER